MPAGYINEDKTQYLLKVGDQYKSIDALKKTLLCHMKDIGNVRLQDVADITVVNNSADSYAKLMVTMRSLSVFPKRVQQERLRCPKTVPRA